MPTADATMTGQPNLNSAYFDATLLLFFFSLVDV
jgi:hypothetical protein